MLNRQALTHHKGLKKLLGLILILWGVCLTFSVHGSDYYCIDSWACVESVEEHNVVTYWLINRKDFVITSTIEVDTRNLKTSSSQKNKYTVSRVLKGRQRIKVLSLQPIEPDISTWYDESFYWTPGNMHAKHQKGFKYQFPYAKHHYFPIVQGFSGGYSHQGASKYAVDFAMPIGTPVHAARAGTVIDVEESHHKGGASRRYAKYANYVVILHSDGTTGEYYHLNKGGVIVQLGDEVDIGQKIAYSGNTGFSSLPHLHFAVYKAKTHGNYQSLPFTFEGR